MSDLTESRRDALAAVPADAVLAPVWQPGSSHGYVYPSGEKTIAVEDLEALASEGYLERSFIERLSLCPQCASHALNVHEACPSCTSSNLSTFKAYFHFRCGYVGPVESFKAEARGLRCPKCNRILADLGTDHDSPGDYYRCNVCAAMFQAAAAGARCLQCAAALSGASMDNIGQRDVFAYRLSDLGKNALAPRKVEPAASA